jgi:hypothetical protein
MSRMTADERMIVGIGIEIEIEIEIAFLRHYPPWLPMPNVIRLTSGILFSFPFDTDTDSDPDPDDSCQW